MTSTRTGHRPTQPSRTALRLARRVVLVVPLAALVALALGTPAPSTARARPSSAPEVGAGDRVGSTGRRDTVVFESKALASRRSYEVWLPPQRTGKPGSASTPLPIVMLLHGLGGSGKDWFDPTLGGLVQDLERLVATGRIAPFIAVAPNGGNGYWTDHLDRPRNRFGAFIDEVADHAERRFHGSGRRAIVGVSMGGHGAMSRGLMAPGRWAAVVSIAGALFPEPPTHRKIYKDVWGFPANGAHWQATAPMALLGAADRQRPPPIFLHCGRQDLNRFLDMTMGASERLRALGIEHELVLTEGGHDWTTWRPVNERWLIWLDARLTETGAVSTRDTPR